MWKAISILNKQGLSVFSEEIARYLFRSLAPPKNHIKQLQKQDGLVIAEVGVWEGSNALRLLNKLNIEKMYLIDPYEGYCSYTENKSNKGKMRLAKKKAHNKLKSRQNIEWIEKYSNEAICEIDEQLDYVYIDGNHSYSYVKRDIREYYSLLKDGGIIAGHDIDWEGVSQAFIEFSFENNLQPYLEPYSPDWYLIKGKKIEYYSY